VRNRRVALLLSGLLLTAACGERGSGASDGSQGGTDANEAVQDPSAAIYDESRIATFKLTMNAADWDAICNDGPGAGDVWKRADMVWQSESVTGVGVKRSGRGTLPLDTPKPSIRISFNEFEFANAAGPGTPGRKWRSVNRIKLDSMVGNTDTSMMRDRVAYGIFRAVGAPAPRAAHARLYVNDAFKGLYTVEEPVRKDFLETVWREDKGNLYEHVGPTAAWRGRPYGWKGSDPALYVPAPFVAETNYPGGDYRDLVELMNALNNVPVAQIRSSLDARVNVDGLLRYMAITTVIGDNDDLSHWSGGGGGGTNGNTKNHFWYHHVGTNKLEIIKWDPGASQGLYDEMFGLAKGQSPLAYKYELVKLTSWVRSDGVAWSTYRTKIQQILDGPVAKIASRIDTIYDQIKAHAYEDSLKGKGSTGDLDGFTNAEFEAGVTWLKDWYVRRAAYLRGALSDPN
jgi:spore coat protein CotH